MPTYRLATDADGRRIGGSKIAAILGSSPWSSPLEAFEDLTGRAPKRATTTPQAQGIELEEHVSSDWQARHHRDLIGPWDHAWVRDDRPWACASPDRVVAVGTENPRDAWSPDWTEGWEGKTTGWLGEGWGDEGTDQVPAHYLLQCQWYLDFFEMPIWHLCVLAGGRGGLRTRDYVIERDPALGCLLRERAEEFWDRYIVTDTPPPPGPGDAAVLARLLPARSPDLLEPDPRLRALADRWRHAREQAAGWEEQAQAAANELRAAIGDKRGIRGLCTWTRSVGKPHVDLEAAVKAKRLTVPDDVAREFQKPGRATNQLRPIEEA